MKHIELTRDQVAIVDDDVYEELSKHNWFALPSGRMWYARRSIKLPNGKWSNVKMHRQIMGLVEGDGLVVDHINGNGLDNRRENLRVCKNSMNIKNQAPRSGNRYSPYKGVRHNPKYGYWFAQISVNGKRLHLGSFDSDVDAARAYNEAAKRLYGEFAWLNDVPDAEPVTPPAPPAPLSVASTLPESSHSAQSLRPISCGASA